jgi:hypothetical protein
MKRVIKAAFAIIAIASFALAQTTDINHHWILLHPKNNSFSLQKSSPQDIGITKRALKRRAKSLPPNRLIDELDLPVSEAVIAQIKQTGAKIRTVSRWLNSVSVEATSDQLRAIKKIPMVTSSKRVAKLKHSHNAPSSCAALESSLTKGMNTQGLNYGRSETQLTKSKIVDLHAVGINGTGVLIGMLDDGFNKFRTHVALKNINVVADSDFIHNISDVDRQPWEATSQGNHGTGTLSAIGGFDEGQMIGAAYGASFILAKTEMDSSGVDIDFHSEEDTYVAAMEWAERLGADITSSSLGYKEFSDIFAGTNGGGVVHSSDNGISWIAANSGLTSLDVSALIVRENTIFVATRSGGIFKSTNDCKNWVNVQNGITTTDILSLCAKDTILFAGSNGGGIYCSKNYGNSWDVINSGLTNLTVQVLFPYSSDVYIGTQGGGVFRSSDDGTNWIAINSGLTNMDIRSFVVSGGFCFAGTQGGGVFRSSDNGSNWILADAGLTNKYIHSLFVYGTNLFAGTDSGLFVSTDNGVSWNSVDTQLTSSGVTSCLAWSTNLYVGTHGGGILLYSMDNKTWRTVNAGLMNLNVTALAWSASAGDYSTSELDGRTTKVAQAATIASRKGVLVVTAMGNSGDMPMGFHRESTLASPADADSIIAVGATASDGELASWSGCGPTADGRIKPEVVAQGMAIYWANGNSTTSYNYVQGTSCSTPIVAGAAALVLSAHPELSNMQVRQAILATAQHISDVTIGTNVYPNNYYGYGFVDALEAAIYFGPVFSNVPKVVQTTTGFTITTIITSKYELYPDSVFYFYHYDDTSAYTCTQLLPTMNSNEYSVSIPPSPNNLFPSGYFIAREQYGKPRYTPTDYMLMQNYPNPFNYRTTIRFELPITEEVELAVFNLLGQKVKTIFKGIVNKVGTKQWDGTNDHGYPVATGIYFARLKTLDKMFSIKMLLLK